MFYCICCSLFNYSIVAMGGDGTANKVIDGILTHSQKDCDIEPKPGFTPVRAKVPIGIIPVGKSEIYLVIGILTHS